jgi:hypothetical protein
MSDLTVYTFEDEEGNPVINQHELASGDDMVTEPLRLFNFDDAEEFARRNGLAIVRHEYREVKEEHSENYLDASNPRSQLERDTWLRIKE